MNTTTTDEYWDQFYAKTSSGQAQKPSDFANCVNRKVQGMGQLIEFGCGSGQDVRLLGGGAKRFWAIDQSAIAISFCKKMDQKGEYFVGDLNALEEVLNGVVAVTEKTLLYSRFVMHAMSKKDQDRFIHIAGNNQIEDLTIALEYRVLGDEKLHKVYPDHQRHYVDHVQLVNKIEGLGFVLSMSVQAQGLSRFKNEDPLLGRLIASRNL